MKSIPKRIQPAQTHLLAVLLATLTPLAAHAAGPVTPGAGSILRQIQPVEPPSPLSTETGLRIERENGAKLPLGVAFRVKTIWITGNTLFDTGTLHALVANMEGKDLTLTHLDELASRITDFYHSHGYPLSRAIIPAQVIRDGVVNIQIIEARFGKVSVLNSSRVKDSLLEATLAPLGGGAVVSQEAMDRALLLLSDIPGVAVNATLKSGEVAGTSDMLVDAVPEPSVTGTTALDNYGNRYTGRTRLGGTMNLVDPLRYGDVLSFSGLSSGSGMNYGRASYESLINGEGMRLGCAYSALHYILGGPLANLNGNGTAQVESVWVKHPIVRSTEVNVYGQIEFDRTNLQDNLNNNAIQTVRHLDDWTASVSGDSRDTLMSGGINTWNLAETSGQVGFDNGAAQLADAATAKIQGLFTKWNANLSRLQTINENNGLYLSFSGQWANTNLDPSQQMIAGGPYTVRAYDMAVLSSDTGYLGTVEFRHQLGQVYQGQWQAVAFVDSAHVTINRNVWVNGINSATLSGAGVGLNWTGPDQWSARTYIATPVGSAPVLVAAAQSVQTWVEIDKGF